MNSIDCVVRSAAVIPLRLKSHRDCSGAIVPTGGWTDREWDDRQSGWHRSQCAADKNGDREPICESCARRLLERFRRQGLPIPEVVGRSDYFERA